MTVQGRQPCISHALVYGIGRHLSDTIRPPSLAIGVCSGFLLFYNNASRPWHWHCPECSNTREQTHDEIPSDNEETAQVMKYLYNIC